MQTQLNPTRNLITWSIENGLVIAGFTISLILSSMLAAYVSSRTTNTNLDSYECTIYERSCSQHLLHDYSETYIESCLTLSEQDQPLNPITSANCEEDWTGKQWIMPFWIF